MTDYSAGPMREKPTDKDRLAANIYNRLLSLPRTQVGRWSVGLSISFAVLFMLWRFYVVARPIPRPTFFSDPIHAVLILVAAAVAGGVLGLISVVASRECSLHMAVTTLLGAFVLYVAIGETFFPH